MGNSITITITFIPSNDDNDKQPAIHSNVER